MHQESKLGRSTLQLTTLDTIFDDTAYSVRLVTTALESSTTIIMSHLAENAKANSIIRTLPVSNWGNKLRVVIVVLARLFLNPGYPCEKLLMNLGYPYEVVIINHHKTIEKTLCSYLRKSHVFNFTRGGLVELNHGKEQPLQYVVNSGFLASLYADYLNASDTLEWLCGDSNLPIHALKAFSASQRNYILGSNPMNMSYIMGYGAKFHQGASIPKDRIKYSCTGGTKWRDNSSPNPNIINGAMVGGPDKFDKFLDVRGNSYNEPTIARNTGLVAALVSFVLPLK